jgi:nucleotide-binding universal stress UspA family protein
MVEKTKRILVPIGFSEQSLRAFDQAIIVAKLIGADLVLISVIETNSFLQRLLNKEHDEEKLKAEALKHLVELIESRKESGVHMEPMVSRGVVYEEIARAADMLSPELVIMGTNGRPENFNKKMVGSNAFRVVKSVTEPVITMKGERGFTRVKTIVFPVLLDRKSKEKVGECLHWARIFGSQVKIVAVAKDEDEQTKLLPHVTQVFDFITKHGVHAESKIIDAEGRSVPIAVVDYCDEVDADLLIIMEDNDDSIIRILGNEIEDVLYNAEIPVLCVTPKPSKYALGFQAF